MDNKTIAPEIAGIIAFAESLVKKIESREIMQVPEDKKEAMEQELQRSGAIAKCAELKEKLKEFKTKLTQNNGTANNAK